MELSFGETQFPSPIFPTELGTEMFSFRFRFSWVGSFAAKEYRAYLRRSVPPGSVPPEEV